LTQCICAAGVRAGRATDAEVGHFHDNAVRLPRSDIFSSSVARCQHRQQTETSLSDVHRPLYYRSAIDEPY